MPQVSESFLLEAINYALREIGTVPLTDKERTILLCLLPKSAAS